MSSHSARHIGIQFRLTIVRSNPCLARTTAVSRFLRDSLHVCRKCAGADVDPAFDQHVADFGISPPVLLHLQEWFVNLFDEVVNRLRFPRQPFLVFLRQISRQFFDCHGQIDCRTLRCPCHVVFPSYQMLTALQAHAYDRV